jgi:tRNA(fMet)-specific endonuclease VapC
MRYLLDTNICIYLIKKRPLEVLERFRQHSPQDVAISTISLFELQYGIEKSRYRKRSEGALAKFLLPLNLINLERSSAIEAATIRAELEKEGMPPALGCFR